MPTPTLYNFSFGGFCAGMIPGLLFVNKPVPGGFAVILAIGGAGAVVGSVMWWQWVRPGELTKPPCSPLSRRHQDICLGRG